MIVTCMEREIARMTSVVQKRMSVYRSPKRGQMLDAVVDIFRAGSRVRLSAQEEVRLSAALQVLIAREQVIPVSFMWALSWMAAIRWKFLTPQIIYPRLADLWAFFWLEMFNERVKRVYPPGCHFIIIDEVSMVRCMGWTIEQEQSRKKMLQKLYKRFSCISVVDLPEFEKLISVGEPSHAEIIAVLTSTPILWNRLSFECQQRIMWQLFVQQEKSSFTLHEKISPAIWQEARLIKIRMNQLGATRRANKWLEDEVLGGSHFVDAAMIDKGRWSPDISAYLMPQHGGTVLDDFNPGRFSISIKPEFLLDQLLEPVYMKTSELSDNDLAASEAKFVFYWRGRIKDVDTFWHHRRASASPI